MTDGPFGSNLKSSHYVSSGPRVIRLQNIGFGEFIDESAHITEQHFESLRTHEARHGDLVVASLGQDLPRSCLVPSTVGPAVVKADCIRVRLHSDLNARYVNYGLLRPELRRAVADQIHGVGRPRLGLTGIKDLSIPLAPRREQERIVAAIEEHLSRLDAAESAMASARVRLGSLRASLIEHVTAGDWAVRPLGELLVSLRNGCFVSRPNVDPPGLAILRISAVRPLALDAADIRYAPHNLERSMDYKVASGDLLFTRYSGNPDFVGACAVVPTGAAGLLHPDKLIRGVPDPGVVLSDWVALSLSSGRGRREIEQRLKTTAGQVGISGSQLKTVPIPLPPLSIQSERHTAWLTGAAAMSRLQRELDAAAVHAIAARRSVLAAAFSGQLVPQDPDDEPASDLLERIRDQRTAATTVRLTRAQGAGG